MLLIYHNRFFCSRGWNIFCFRNFIWRWYWGRFSSMYLLLFLLLVIRLYWLDVSYLLLRFCSYDFVVYRLFYFLRFFLKFFLRLIKILKRGWKYFWFLLFFKAFFLIVKELIPILVIILRSRFLWMSKNSILLKNKNWYKFLFLYQSSLKSLYISFEKLILSI